AIAPHVELARDEAGVNYVQIIARYSTEPRELTLRLYQELFEPVRHKFVEALRRAQPDLSDGHLYRAYGFLTAIMLTSLVDAGYESLSGKPPIPDDLEELIGILVAFSAAGFRGLLQQHKE
ncbi:MAG: hypothetical protein GY783_18060, partial [Gammaproteobacteria bacterium]|nr:hypothetical protein [Gammaproteobacteria bacterium]